MRLNDKGWTEEDEKKDRAIARVFIVGFILFMLACYLSGKLAH
jgi:hypothetical protein